MEHPIQILKSLESILDRTLAKRYIRNVSMPEMQASYYYNNALRDLNNKDSESAIHNIIMALSADIEFSPALHLAKTMLFGLSKKYNESGAELYKQKYRTLSTWIEVIEKEIKDIDKEIILLQNQKLKEKEKGLWRILQLIFFKKSVKDYDKLINKCNLKKEEVKKRLQFASKLAQIEEYAKVLSLIVEICLYPAKFAWVVS
ncbi:MAG: hypothetical protein KatS3mg068_2579 [Candidatus Sericytochromatia bacterium]|nr:MAG: hypothetical protein KatS3mg068_2579 [Candidatus Sericytochromatia bacterium]